MTRRLGALCVAALVAPAAALAQPRATREYVVQPGDTCVGVARRMYRNGSRTDVIHASNPQLGPAPHRLAPGTTLTLPSRLPPPRGPLPVAFVTGANNRVEVQPQPADPGRPAHRNDPLFLGARVSTSARSSAEVTFADETQLRLYENTLVVILGDTNTRVRRAATAADTTLVSGSLRAFLSDLSAPAPSASAPVPAPPPRARRRRPPRRARPTLALRTATGGRVILGEGESQVSVADGGTTLSVFAGSSRIQSGNRTVTVAAGYAARAERGRAPSAPRLLPAAPTWLELPPGVVFVDGDAGATLSATYAPGPGEARPAAARWRVQLARDPSFVELQLDATAPEATRALRAERVPVGRYHARVSAVDADGLEGPPSDVARVVVARPRWVPSPRPHRATLELPAGLYCGLDGAALALTGEGPAPEADRLSPHSLRCALDADGARSATTTLPAERRGPFTVVARLVDADGATRSARVRVRLVDASGDDVRERAPGVAVVDAPSVTAGEVSADPGAEPGVWSVPLRWSDGAREVRLRLAVGDEVAETVAFALPAAPRAPARETAAHRLWARGEGFGAALLSGYQRNADANAYYGNTPGMGFGFGGALRAGVDLARPSAGAGGAVVSLYGVGAGWRFPRDAGEPGVATLLGGGLRVGLRAGRLTPWVDAGAGAVLTGGALRAGVEAGVGLDVRVSRSVSFGPVLRYLQVVQPEAGDAYDAIDEDARALSAGVGVTLRAPSPAE
ncbi:MAG: LysM domain-containing protein [Polyangiales bacterium]